MNFVEVCRKIVSIESTPSTGNAEAARFVGAYCQELGYKVSFQSETTQGLEQINLIVRPSETCPSNELLLQSHLDTADPGGYALWQKTGHNPFNASIYDDCVYGLGVASGKLDLLCKIHGAREFIGKDLKRPFVIVGTFGYQTGMDGALKLMRRKKVNAKWALVGEPTSLKLCTAAPGVATLEVTIPFSEQEREYHAAHDVQESTTSQSKIFRAHPTGSDSAIFKMLEYISQLPEGFAILDLDGGTHPLIAATTSFLEIDMVDGLKESVIRKLTVLFEAFKRLDSEFQKYPDVHFVPPYPTANIGTIRTFEDQVLLTASCRLPPAVPEEVYEKWMEMLRQACDGVGATFAVLDHKKSFLTPPDAPFLQACKKTATSLGLDARTGAVTFSSEASIFSRLGVESVVFGPGLGQGLSNLPSEHIKLKELDQATEFYKHTIGAFCL